MAWPEGDELHVAVSEELQGQRDADILACIGFWEGGMELVDRAAEQMLADALGLKAPELPTA